MARSATACDLYVFEEHDVDTRENLPLSSKWVYETIERRPSVCPIDRQQRRRAAGLLLSEIYRPTGAEALSSNGAVQQAPRSAADAGGFDRLSVPSIDSSGDNNAP